MNRLVHEEGTPAGRGVHYRKGETDRKKMLIMQSHNHIIE